MANEMDYEDMEDDILSQIEESRKRKRVLEDESEFKSSINKKKLSKQELDELFLY